MFHDKFVGLGVRLWFVQPRCHWKCMHVYPVSCVYFLGSCCDLAACCSPPSHDPTIYDTMAAQTVSLSGGTCEMLQRQQQGPPIYSKPFQTSFATAPLIYQRPRV